MIRFPLACAAFILICLALPGCSRPPARNAPSTPAATDTPGTDISKTVAHEIAESVIHVTDPKGRWTFVIRADKMEAEDVHGPYTMHPAVAEYREQGQPPVTMSAQSARVDEGNQRVLLEGKVTLAADTWRLTADRVEYALATGKVAATGHTNWTITEGAHSTLNTKDHYP